MENIVFNPALHVECGSSSPNLQSKENSYSEKPSNKCKFCGRGFQRSSHLQRHERIHTGERPYKCTFCDRSFTQIGHLHVHERIHTGERPYKCKFCNRTFTQNGSLQAHERIHTKEKPFQCKYCGCSFTDSGNLQKHLRSLHSFECSLKKQNAEHDTEPLQNTGPVNVTSNVADQPLNFDKKCFEGKNIDSQTVFDPSPQPNTSQGFELENRNYVSNDEMYMCRLCSYSFRQENELNLHYITHFDSL